MRLVVRYAKLINDSIRDVPDDMTVCVHMCRGNHAGGWFAEGGYDPVAEISFSEIEVDGFFLEYDTPRAGSFVPLRHLGKGKIAVLGLVTTKSAEAGKQGRSEAPHRRGVEVRSAGAPRAQPAMRLCQHDRGQPAHRRGREAEAASRRRDRARGLGFLGRSGDFGRAISP